MNQDQEKLITIARSWLGTPWRHNQCQKGLGVDCANFVWSVTKECGVSGSSLPLRYSRIARYKEIEKYLDEHLKPTNKLRETNILLFELNGFNNHLAFATDIGMIHASLSWHKVVEHAIDGLWERSLVKQWEVF